MLSDFNADLFLKMTKKNRGLQNGWYNFVNKSKTFSYRGWKIVPHNKCYYSVKVVLKQYIIDI